MPLEPVVGLFFGEDRKNVDFQIGHIVINAEMGDAKPVFGLAKALQPLDARLAVLAWFTRSI